MASFWRERLSDEDDELDDVDTTEERNGQHISKWVKYRKSVPGEGVRITVRFDLEKKLFQLEEKLDNLKEENEILKIELKRLRMRQNNIQPNRETDQYYPGHRPTDGIDSEKNHAHFQQKVEERFIALERRIDTLEKTESKHQPQLGKKKDEILMKFDKGERFIEQKRIAYHDNASNEISPIHGNQNQPNKERYKNCKASKTNATGHVNANPVVSSDQGRAETVQCGLKENDNTQFLKYEGSFKCKWPLSEFFHFCLSDTLKHMLKLVLVTEFLSKETKISIRFEGSIYETPRVLKRLQDLKDNVISETWNLLDHFQRHEVLLIQNSFESGQMKEKIDSYKSKDKCLVVAEFPKFVLASHFNQKCHQTNQLSQINIGSREAELMKTQSPWLLPADKFGFAGLSPPHYMTYDSESESDDNVSSDDSVSSDDNVGSDDSVSSYDMLTPKHVFAIQATSNAVISVTTLNGVNSLESVKNKIVKDIRETTLQVDYFNQNLFYHLSHISEDKILKEAMRLSVWAERSIYPKTKHAGFKLTGEKKAIAQIKIFIQQVLLEESSHLPKKRLTSDKAPRRGTVEFMRYAADCDEPIPSYWSLNKSIKFWSNLRNGIYWENNKRLLVKVDTETKDAITTLVADTLDLNHVGLGKDATGLRYSSLKVLDVRRVENPKLFELYRLKRKSIFDKMVRTGKICPDIGKLTGSKGRVCTTELLSDSMKKELYHEVNEHYLFHGTKSDTVSALIQNGFDPRLSNGAAVFGKGIYAAERVTKSDQYSDSKQQRTPDGTKLTLVLTRMLLGNVFLCDSNHTSVRCKASKRLTRPPCMSCSDDICKCGDQTFFDSVMGDGRWLFREFVVYESSQCYPEYVITYKRV